MFCVYGDLTPFYDRWGRKHTRLIAVSSWRPLAYLKAWWWVQNHVHGSAFITDRELTPDELGWN